MKYDGAGLQSNTVGFKLQRPSTFLNLYPPPVQEIAVLRSIEKVLRSEDNAAVGLRI